MVDTNFGFKLELRQGPDPAYILQFLDLPLAWFFTKWTPLEKSRRKCVQATSTRWDFWLDDASQSQLFAKQIVGQIKQIKSIHIKGLRMDRPRLKQYFKSNQELNKLLKYHFETYQIVEERQSEEYQFGDLILYYHKQKTTETTAKQLAHEFQGLTLQLLYLEKQQLITDSPLKRYQESMRKILPHICTFYKNLIHTRFCKPLNIILNDIGPYGDGRSIYLEVIGLRKYFYELYEKIMTWLELDLQFCIKSTDKVESERMPRFKSRVEAEMEKQKENATNIAYVFLKKGLLLLGSNKMDGEILYELTCGWYDITQLLEERQNNQLFANQAACEELQKLLRRGVRWKEFDFQKGKNGKINILCDSSQYLKAANICRDFVDRRCLVPHVYQFKTQAACQYFQQQLYEKKSSELIGKLVFREFRVDDGNPCRIGYSSNKLDEDAVQNQLQLFQSGFYDSCRTILHNKDKDLACYKGVEVVRNMFTPAYQGYLHNQLQFQIGMGTLTVANGVNCCFVDKLVVPVQCNGTYLSPISKAVLNTNAEKLSQLKGNKRAFKDRVSTELNQNQPPREIVKYILPETTQQIQQDLKSIINVRRDQNKEADVLWFVVPVNVEDKYIDELVLVIKKYLCYRWKNPPSLRRFGFICASETHRREIVQVVKYLVREAKRKIPDVSNSLLQWLSVLSLRNYRVTLSGIQSLFLGLGFVIQRHLDTISYRNQGEIQQSRLFVVVPLSTAKSHEVEELIVNCSTRTVFNLTKKSMTSTQDLIKSLKSATQNDKKQLDLLEKYIQEAATTGNSPQKAIVTVLYTHSCSPGRICGRVYEVRPQQQQLQSYVDQQQKIKYQIIRSPSQAQLVSGHPNSLIKLFG